MNRLGIGPAIKAEWQTPDEADSVPVWAEEWAAE
jgi:hypothetical protein